MKRRIISNLFFLITLVGYSQNIVIVNGDATEAFDSVPSDHTIGNPCGVPNFINIYYNGDYTLPGNIYIQDAIVTINGKVDLNGFTVTYLCDNSEWIVNDDTLSVPKTSEEEVRLYPNPTSGIFYVTTNQPFTVEIYNLNGQLVGKTPDLRGLPSGLYLVLLTIGSKSKTYKIIKK